MIRDELIRRSPMRILEKSTCGGLGKGNIGVIAGPKGLGKTACLVHLATDQLIEGKHVIHVSFAQDTSHIIAWYEDIFDEITKRTQLTETREIHDELVRHRVIMNFSQDGVSALQIQRSLRSMILDGHFNADAVFFDGYDFSTAETGELSSFKRFAEETGLELWFSASIPAGKPAVPEVLEKHIRYIAVLIVLEPGATYITLKLLKDHEQPAVGDLRLRLDPLNLLIAEENEPVEP